MTPGRRRVDVNIEELDRVLDGARETPLSEADCEKVKTALHALAAMLVRPRNTEKTNAVLPKSEDSGKMPALSRMRARHRRPKDTGAMVPRHSVAHKRSRSSTRT